MEIGIIGLGDMGKSYAKEFSKKGYTVNGCDLHEKKSQLEQELQGTEVNILEDGVAVSRRSDLIIYAVEAENIENVVKMYGPSTRMGSIVGGLTSVKTPEIKAFEKYLPQDVNIITFHPMHGPSVSPEARNLAVIKHRSTKEAYNKALDTFKLPGSKIEEIANYKIHDKITADTQSVTHIAFESMGTAWKKTGIYPWQNPSYVSCIDNVKILVMLRIYGGKSHVYSGLAFLNPYAREQINQYALSESELFKLMIQEEETKFKERIKKAGDFIFGDCSNPILLDDKIMQEYNIGTKRKETENSHLSLLSMVDAWHKLKINPYKNLICQTPLFRLRLGIAEYLFRNSDFLEESINTAVFNKEIRGDDFDFSTAVREWVNIIKYGNSEAYKLKFEATKDFFRHKIPDGLKKSDELIQRLIPD